MNKLKTFLVRSRRAIVVAVGIALIFISSAFVTSFFEISKNLEIFTTIYRELNIYYVDETEPGKLMKTGIDAMLKSLDPYTVYYPESRIEDYRFMTTGQYGGIGSLIQTIDGQIVISEPYEGFAAAKAGLKAGDIILEIDGEGLDDKSQGDISDILKGQSGTEVELLIKRPGSENQTFKFIREEVKIPDVPYYGMLDDKTGYIKLTGFTKTASTEVRNAIKDLQGKQGAKQLVLDLRGNGGGLLREAVNIVNLFIPKGQEIVSTKGKLEEWNKTHIALNPPMAPEIPLTILIDGGSASASEIVSGALQDLDRAVVIGSESFGKGLVQQTKDIAYNTKMKLTVAKYYIPSGRCIQRLDYSNRGQDGGVDAVADSMISKFATSSGRPVFDGRGVFPDYEVELEEASNILAGLVGNHVVFDYATKFARENDSISEASSFRLTDEQYNDFVATAAQSDFEYRTATEHMYQELKKTAEAEHYYDGAESEFDALFDQIKPTKSNDLVKFKDQIKQYLENEIVARYYYQTGRVENALPIDPYIVAVKDVFEQHYKSILSGEFADN
ncbi:MAG: carboxyl-terminal processing protease [Flavobacteriales bacterium]|jgi:carboxyl-terminal processing protease